MPTVYVDTKGVGEGTPASDYATLAAAIAGETSTAGDLIIYCRATDGDADATIVSISGMDADTVTVQGEDSATGFPLDGATNPGVWDDTCYRIAATSTTWQITVLENYVTIKNIQINAVGNGNYPSYGINLTNGYHGLTVDGCIIKSTNHGPSGSPIFGIQIATATTTSPNTIINTVIYDFYRTANDMAAVRSNYVATNVIHCTISSCDIGIKRDGGTVTATNCVIFNNDDDFSGTVGITNCAADDVESGVTVDLNHDASGEYAAAMPDYATLDFYPANDTDYLVEAGTSTAVTVDILGAARDASTPDIGAFEYVGGGGPTFIPRREIGAGVGRGIWR